MHKTEIEYDEIPDSLFREIFRKNTVFLLTVLLIVVSSTSFLFYKVIEPSYKTISYFNLICKTETKCNLNKDKQKLIRILKSNAIRSHIVDKFNLSERYDLNMSDENYNIELDKNLYDNLKVERQLNGAILVSFIDKNSDLSIEVIKYLVNYAYENNRNELVDIEWEIFPSENSTYKVQPKFLSLFLLILAPIFLIAVVLIAVKEKIYLNSVQNTIK